MKTRTCQNRSRRSRTPGTLYRLRKIPWSDISLLDPRRVQCMLFNVIALLFTYPIVYIPCCSFSSVYDVIETLI